MVPEVSSAVRGLGHEQSEEGPCVWCSVSFEEGCHLHISKTYQHFSARDGVGAQVSGCLE